MKKKPKTRRKAEKGNPVTSVVVVRQSSPVEKWRYQELLRNAEVAYLTDRYLHPAEYWWERTCQGDIPLAEFLRRARLGRWAARREAYWEAVQSELLRRHKNKAVNDRSAEIDKLQELQDSILKLITPKEVGGKLVYPVKPGSLEGMITAFTRVTGLLNATRDVVLTMLEPEFARNTAAQDSPDSVFSADEIREVANLLLTRKRQEQQRRLLGDGVSNGSEEEREENG